MALWQDFKKFAFKGNVIDLAIGVIVGAAFGKIVSALVADLIMPIVALVLPGGDWRESGLVLQHGATPKDDVVLKYGDFLGSVLDFFLVAFVLFIIVSKIVKAAESRLRGPEVAAAAPATKECPYCIEIVPARATRCKSCTSELSVAASPAESTSSAT